MRELALVLGLALAVSLGSLAAPAEKGSWTGWITDAKCAGARADKGTSDDHAGCAQKCIEGGQKAVFVSDDDDEIYQVKNQEAVTRDAGQHVEVSGSLDRESKTLTVDEVIVLEEEEEE